MDQVSVTNLIDVLLVLLIIFMITARTFAHQSRSPALPSVTPESTPAAGRLMILVDGAGEISVERKNLDLDGLRIHLGNLSPIEKKNPVVIKADGRVPYGRLTEILDTVRASGVQAVTMAVKEAEGP